MRRYESTQKFIEGVRNFELKRNFELMYAQEHHTEAPPTVEVLWFTVPQYLRMRSSTRFENYPAPQQQQQSSPANKQNPVPSVPPPAATARQRPQQPAAYR